MPYNSWKALTAKEKEGVDYAVQTSAQRSNWVHVAPHGGILERLTLEMAEAVANERRQSYACLKVMASGSGDRLRIDEENFDAPWCLDLMKKATFGATYHAVVQPKQGDPEVFAYVSGLDTKTRDQVIAGFKSLKIFSKAATNHGNADDPKTLTNLTKSKKGVRIELSRALREKLVVSGNVNDTSKGYTKLWTDVIAMLAGVTGPADVYQSWAELAANEEEGVDYRIEQTARPSKWSHIAIHGGAMEQMATQIAKACADERQQNYYAMVGTRKKYNDRLRIPDILFDEPKCLKMQGTVESSISYHAAGGADQTVRVDGLDTTHVAALTANLKAEGFTVIAATTHGSGKAAKDPKNPCNRTKTKKGIHVELTRGLRDKMSASGDAADLSKGTTALFTKFVTAVAKTTGPLDQYQNWAELSKVEKEGVDYQIELTRRGSSFAHLAIHGKPMEQMVTEVAKKTAEVAYQNFYSLVGLKKKYNDRLVIPSAKYDEPQCVTLQSQVDYTVSYHGTTTKAGEPAGGIARVGGLQTTHRDLIIKALKAQGFAAESIEEYEARSTIAAEVGGTHEGKNGNTDPANIVNRNQHKAGVQIELTRALRDSMAKSGNAADLSQGTTPVFDKFVAAVTSVTLPNDMHDSWTTFSANEREGTHYEIRRNVNPDSNVAHIAIHGGPSECMTASLAEEAAQPKNQNYYVQYCLSKYPQRLRLPSTLYVHKKCQEVQDASSFTFSYHGVSDREGDPAGGVVYVGGADTQFRDDTASALRAKGFSVRIGGLEWGKASPKGAVAVDNAAPANMTNKNKLKMGVQLELNRTLRNRMSSTGNACDEDAAKTQVFRDFLSAIRSVANRPDVPEQETGEQGCIRYAINKFFLDQPKLGFRLMKGTEYAPSVSPRLFSLSLPGWHGQMPVWHDPIDAMKVTFEVQIRASSAGKLRQRWDDFVGLCGVGKFVPVTLERWRGTFLSTDHGADPHDRNRPFGEWAHARLESLSPPEFEAGNKMLTAKAVFDCPAGVWRTHKVYYQYYPNGGKGQKCAVAAASAAPVYDALVRVQGGKGVYTWSLVDQQSNTGIAWTLPPGVTLSEGQWVYASVETMQAFVAPKKEWPTEGERFEAFMARIGGKAAWADYRYIRNGPLNLTSRVHWTDPDPAKGKDGELAHTSFVQVWIADKDKKDIAGREMAVMARAARL